ncbi:LPS-assembly protein LptD [Prolixibacteraceae bacterium JC049]|nr:LPS-assembly protein LptD [Prolixibacteraceae bacterium JC049]
MTILRHIKALGFITSLLLVSWGGYSQSKEEKQTDSSDTTRIERKASFLDAEITYSAKDSNVVIVQKRLAFMYRDAKINFKEIELTANYIELDLEKKEVFAKGIPNDTTGVMEGNPVFRDGGQEFKADSMKYNFETKKAKIYRIITEQNGGFVHAQNTKMVNDSTFCMQDGKYTTCDHEHPHFYLKLSKAKVLKDKAVVSGPAYMVLEDFPIYFPVLPFGYFPNTSKYSSGVLIPTYGEENQRGFFLRDGGYYWAFNDYFDFALRTELYSKGSWGLKGTSNYKKRYRYSGSFDAQYFRNKFEPNTKEEFQKGTSDKIDFSVRWSHSQDSKANPSTRFSASVNFSTSTFERNTAYRAQNYLTNTKQSSISYSKKFENSPFNMSMSLRHSQNSRDTTISLTLPELTFTMAKVYPFRKKGRVGKSKWYEKFGFSYSGNMRHMLNNVHESDIFVSEYWKSGAQHNFSISLPTFKALKYINFSPSVSYRESWNNNYISKDWQDNTIKYNYITESYDSIAGTGISDPHTGFKRSYEYSYGVSASTTVYGMYKLGKNSKVEAIRHVMKPSISLSYRPDFGDEKFGFYRSYYDKNKKRDVYYSIFENSLFRGPGRGESGSISFTLNNNLEMKVKNDADTTSTEKYRKVKLLENLSFSGSYNMIADSFKLSTINIRGRTKIKGININFGGIIDPYTVRERQKVDSFGNVKTNLQGEPVMEKYKIDEYAWNNGQGIGRLTNANLSFGLNFSSKKGGKDDTENNDAMPGTYYTGYTDFDIPWDFSLDYSLNYTNRLATKEQVIQTLGFRGSLSLTPKWKVQFTSGFDFKAGDFTYTNVSINRDLHCWQASFNFVPFGYRRFYMFTLNVKSSILKDLKLTKNQTFFNR